MGLLEKLSPLPGMGMYESTCPELTHREWYEYERF